MAPQKELPVISRKPRTDRGSVQGELWLRVSGFLSLRSRNTQETYLGVIKEWCAFLGATPGTADAAQKITAASDVQAIAYRAWLERQPGEAPRMKRRAARVRREVALRDGRAGRKEGLDDLQSNATIAKKFAVLRRIYRMLHASGLFPGVNPFDSDRVPPPPKDSGRKRPTEMVNFELVQAIVDAPDSSTIKGRRDRGVLAALFGGALRRSEVMGLRVGDVRCTAQGTTFLYLRATKARKDAQQALPSWAAQAVQDVVRDRRSCGAEDGDYLFVSFTGQAGKTATEAPISASGVYGLFKLYTGIAGAGEFLTPHSARATAITKLLADGIPHRRVQDFSRHSSIQMVELYDKRRAGVDENAGVGLSFRKR